MFVHYKKKKKKEKQQYNERIPTIFILVSRLSYLSSFCKVKKRRKWVRPRESGGVWITAWRKKRSMRVLSLLPSQKSRILC